MPTQRGGVKISRDTAIHFRRWSPSPSRRHFDMQFLSALPIATNQGQAFSIQEINTIVFNIVVNQASEGSNEEI